MTQIGQIVYNVEDFSNTGGMLSTNNNDYSEVLDSFKDPNKYEMNKINIYDNNIFSSYISQGYNITRLGVQAPPGTIFYLKDNDRDTNEISFMVGRTGIYELNEEIKNIDHLRFKRPIKFTLDSIKSNQYMEEGIAQMEKAKISFDKSYKDLKAALQSSTGSLTNEEFWEQYDNIYKEYSESYDLAHARYIQGLNGIYKDSTIEQDLKNIIIDFTYERGNN